MRGVLCDICYAPKHDFAASGRVRSRRAPAEVTLYPWNGRDGGYVICSVACAKTLLGIFAGKSPHSLNAPQKASS